VEDGAHARDKSIYHKNLMPVTYVIGDVAGVIESPVYAIQKMNQALRASTCADSGNAEPTLKILNATCRSATSNSR